MKKALITGSAGFVGQRMVAALQDTYELDCVDIKTGIDARDFFRGHGYPYDRKQYDLVVHLAAVVGGRAMIEGNPLAVAVDLSIDAEMFQWAIRTQQPHILYFSSSAAYPIHWQNPIRGHTDHYTGLNEQLIDLDRVQSPDLTYGWAKLTGEMQARYARQHGVKVTIARPFSGTGPTQSLDYPVPAIIDRALRRQNPIDIWSNSVRDFVHIDDLVDVALTAVELGIEEPFNIGTGNGVSFSEVARMAAHAVGDDARVRILDDKPAGVAYRVADPTFMQSFYAKPLRTIEEIIQEMVSPRAWLLT